MKEIDDTPVPESESEVSLMVMAIQIAALELRIAELEAQRVANESNQDDPEWY